MTEKELRKLNRAELLEMLVDQGTELQNLREKLSAAETALQNREIAITKAGSIAEASLMLNGVFDAAQRACEQYTENVRQLSERQEAICAKMETESQEKAAQILAEAEQKSTDMNQQAQAQCAEMIRQAKEESQKYWDEVSDKLEAFCEEHEGLREILSVIVPSKQ